MSESSPNSSPPKPTLAIDHDTWVARIGPRRHRLLTLWTRDVVGCLEAGIAPYVSEETTLLDAGCSRGERDLPSIGRAGCAVGCDVDMAGLRANTQVGHRVCGTVDALPFPDATFNVIACKWVVEHLPDPLHTFREFRRVLRPGGIVAILTPNAGSLFGMASRLIPHSLKQWIKSSLFGGLKEDTFPTPYRVNTPAHLRAAMGRAGFELVEFHLLAGMWSFLIFSEPLARLARAMERAQTRIPGLRRYSTHMAGVWQKPLAGEAS